ncbi:MAG: hypothetical protein NTW03_00930, partial [Verrucomicrobia bacterium]|nr:hypothetical protein [Verrucomicrobiota bacterium]
MSVSGYPDFRLDAVSISSYSDSSDRYGSVLAHGELDNLVVATPALPRLTGGFSNSCWHAQFSSRSNWLYALERSSTFTNWNLVAAWTAGNGGAMYLAETNRAAAVAAFYRLRLQKE